ncbi:AbrB/MazE/SpoVT family DNA-binding domain-containing protein [Sphingomonas endolithica]|uniref:AbrB/MazE/SpoVT family DNA-binding domain-containing protein n=1 Tax=Sphingomonas endolithica TaxID=2972485 RepID=UPI0021AF6CB0|nr:AbrB/MazE/SpoVT family DNA-binding domain-containing protein [Sphingomonas sp. ZFBP2030]
MQVAKWGNSLAVRLPKHVVLALDLKAGDDVTLRAREPGTLDVSKTMTREEALMNLRRFRGMIPADFKFDRDEANAR